MKTVSWWNNNLSVIKGDAYTPSTIANENIGYSYSFSNSLTIEKKYFPPSINSQISI